MTIFSLRMGFSASALALFALSLGVPSGYSYGAIGMLLMSLLALPLLCRSVWDPRTKTLVALFVLGGLMWGVSYEQGQGWALTGSDYWPKYWLAALCMAAVGCRGVHPQAVIWGLGLGALGALGIAGYQYLVLGWDKAWGFTNAIQYGGIAMYLGISTWCIALLAVRSRWQCILLWLLGALGVLASLLSESRGAWVVAPLLMVFFLVVLSQNGHKRWALRAACVAVLLALAVLVPYWDKFGGRIWLAVHELQQYFEMPETAATTSIGQRMEQWRLAWDLGAQHPVLGWGVEGFIHAKQVWVEAGKAHPSVLEYGHTHNEILDMWVKRGLWGIVVLLLLYVVPLYVFMPLKARMQWVPQSSRSLVLALRTIGAMLPLAYFGFGWTQVFFAHNSGNLFYLFGLVALWGALLHVEQNVSAVTSVSPAESDPQMRV